MQYIIAEQQGAIMPAMIEQGRLKAIYRLVTVTWWVLWVIAVATMAAVVLPHVVPLNTMLAKSAIPLQMHFYANGLEFTVPIRQVPRQFWVMGLGELGAIALALFAVFHLRNAVRDICLTNIFGTESFRRMKWIAIGVVVGAMSKLIGARVLVGLFESDLALADVQLRRLGFIEQLFYDGPFIYIVFGLTFYALAEVFRAGGELKKDLEYTI